MFKAVYDEFHRTLASQNSQLYNMLLKQEAFINKIAAAQRMVRPTGHRTLTLPIHKYTALGPPGLSKTRL